MNRLLEIVQYRDMISSLVRRELRGRYAKSVLGLLWSFLSPMFQILIYTFVFRFIFKNDMPNYYIFLMTGLLPWTFFTESFGTGSMTIVANAEMVKKIYFPREVLVISEVNAKLVNMLLSFVVMFIFIIISGLGFSKYVLLLPVIVLSEYLLAMGFSLFVSCITVYLRDMEYIVNVILMAWIWATPILYNIKNLDEKVQTVLRFNPLTAVIVSYQDILYWQKMPDIVNIVLPFAEGILVLCIGELVFYRSSKRFAEEM